MQEKPPFSSVFVQMRKKLETAVRKIAPDSEIEDIVQDTYLRIVQSEQLDCIKQPSSFMYKTAINLAKDHVKSANHRLVTGVDNVDELCEPHHYQDKMFDIVATEQEFAIFCDAVSHLPEQCRRVFVLRKVYGFSQQEISESLNLSISTVGTHLAVGVKRTLQHMRKNNLELTAQRSVKASDQGAAQ